MKVGSFLASIAAITIMTVVAMLCRVRMRGLSAKQEELQDETIKPMVGDYQILGIRILGTVPVEIGCTDDVMEARWLAFHLAQLEEIGEVWICDDSKEVARCQPLEWS